VRGADYRGRRAGSELGETLVTCEADALSGKAVAQMVEAGAWQLFD
jgi:hypothetical protein